MLRYLARRIYIYICQSAVSRTGSGDPPIRWKIPILISWRRKFPQKFISFVYIVEFVAMGRYQDITLKVASRTLADSRTGNYWLLRGQCVFQDFQITVYSRTLRFPGLPIIGWFRDSKFSRNSEKWLLWGLSCNWGHWSRGSFGDCWCPGHWVPRTLSFQDSVFPGHFGIYHRN